MSELSVRPDEWAMVKEMATILHGSGMLPESVKSPHAALAIILKGRELGFPPMASFSQINIIKGKPTLSAEGMLALIYKMYPNAEIEYLKNDTNVCEIEAVKNGKKNKFSFTMEDAKTAKLLGKQNWQLYPRAMLRSRCISEMARSMFPECLMGCSYTEEELEDIPHPPKNDQENDKVQKVIEAPKNPEPVVYSHDRKDHNELLAKFCKDALQITERESMVYLSEKASDLKVPLKELENFLRTEVELES